jgi:hypothetical protein
MKGVIMKKILASILLIAVMFCFTGCSVMSYNSSREEMVREQVVASGDEAAIKAFQMNGTVGVAVDISAVKVLTKHPIRQLGAALVDAGLLYGAYMGIESLTQNSSNDGNRNLTISTTGTGNVYNINTGDAANSNADDNPVIQGDSNQDEEK